MTIKVFAVYEGGRREEIGPDEDGFYSPPEGSLFIEYVQSGYYDFNAWPVVADRRDAVGADVRVPCEAALARSAEVAGAFEVFAGHGAASSAATRASRVICPPCIAGSSLTDRLCN